MAGGRFDKLVGKVRPGTYINLDSTVLAGAGTGTNGVVVLPLIDHDYGPTKEFVAITNSNPDAQFEKLGYSVYDDNANMLLIREALKCAQTVVVYNASENTTKATNNGGGISATAKYPGSRGNKLSYSVTANPVGGFDIAVFFDGRKASYYEGVKTADGAAAISDPYVTFTKEGDLAAIASVALAEGADVKTSNADVTAFLDAIEGVQFNALCFPSTNEALVAAAISKIKYLQESVGKNVFGVIADTAGVDYEYIINVTNSVVVDGKELTNAQATAWVAGATAGASYVESNTYRVYEGATGIVGAKTHEQAVNAINSGEIFFTLNEAGAVVVEYDINSLVSFTNGKDESYRKNRVARVFNAFKDRIKAEFPPNKYSNSATGWDVMEGMGRAILKEFYEAGAITDVDYEADFAVDRANSAGDKTYFNVGIKPVDSAEKLYFSIATR